MHAYLVCIHSIIRYEGLESPQVLASMSSFIPSTMDLEGWLYLSIPHCPLAQFPDSLLDEEHLEVYNTLLLLLLPREQIRTGVHVWLWRRQERQRAAIYAVISRN